MTTRILIGHVLTKLAELPDESVHCVVTSPPYLGLRDYQIEPQVWGGEPCEHEWGDALKSAQRLRNGDGASTLPNAKRTRSDKAKGYEDTLHPSQGAFCRHCNAWRGDLGLEPMPALYVEHMVEVFRAVRRVLRRDGTLWLNIGDSYAGGGRSYPQTAQTMSGPATPDDGSRRIPANLPGIKPKDLLGIPWMLAFALRDDGWYLRSEITWAKRVPMPESVTDRPTSATEKVFLLAKSSRYFYDAEATKEDASDTPGAAAWRRIFDPEKQTKECALKNDGIKGGNDGDASARYKSTRNLRNFWLLGPEPFPEAHFACVDEETECLTAAGWRRHGDVEVGQQAAQFDLTTQTLSWGTVEAVARYEVEDQPMIVGKRRDLSMMLTPNHRCVIQRRRAHGEAELGLMPPDIIRADRLLTSHRIPTAASWVPGGDTSIATEWAELLGWYVAEGHESKQSLAIEIYQSASANPEKVERIAGLLRQVGAEWTMARAQRLYRGAPHEPVAFRVTGYAAVRLRELAPGKQLPDGLLLWSQDRLQALMDGLIAGDGHIRTDDRATFIQKDTDTADMVQAIGVRLGLAATLTAHASGTWRVYFTKHRTRSFRGTAGKGDPLETALYSGIVWCPKLPHGTWVARRDGRVFITGNTFPTEIPRRAILAGTSARGVCPKCGAPWGRVVNSSKSTSDRVARGKALTSPRHDGNSWNENNGRGFMPVETETIGWRATCSCYILNAESQTPSGDDQPQCVDHHRCQGGLANRRALATTDDDGRDSRERPAPIPATVIDPFLGAGTTALVADQLGRDCIGIELSAQYSEMARDRIIGDAPLFAQVAAE